MCSISRNRSLAGRIFLVSFQSYSASIPTIRDPYASKQPSTAWVWPSRDPSPHPECPSESVIFTNSHLGGTRKYSTVMIFAIEAIYLNGLESFFNSWWFYIERTWGELGTAAADMGGSSIDHASLWASNGMGYIVINTACFVLFFVSFLFSACWVSKSALLRIVKVRKVLLMESRFTSSVAITVTEIN